MKKLVVISLVAAFMSCTEEKEPEVFIPSEAPAASTNVYVLNEGNFNSANGSISVYNTITEKISDQVFQSNNSSRPLGDVVQSMTKIGNQYFIVVNNSKKIEVVSSQTFKSSGTIDNGLTSPRYILPINSTKAYVSDLTDFVNKADGKINIINPQTLAVTGSIKTSSWTEEMLLIGDTAFVCQVDSNQLIAIDVNKDEIVGKVKTNLQPQHLEIDANGKIWVSCSGGYNDKFPALHQIDPKNLTVLKTLEFADNTKSIGKMEMNRDKTKVLYLMGDLFEVSINASSLPASPLVASNSRLFNNLAVHERTGEIYISDAIDYVQKGVVYRLNSTGDEISAFKVGIIPGNIYFEN